MYTYINIYIDMYARTVTRRAATGAATGGKYDTRIYVCGKFDTRIDILHIYIYINIYDKHIHTCTYIYTRAQVHVYTCIHLCIYASINTQRTAIGRTI